MTEQEMRELEAPHPKTAEELLTFITKLTSEENDDYGKAVYCISLAATAAFNFAASAVGASGFQASCADMDVIKRTRRMQHGFQIVDWNHFLYPQYMSDPVVRAAFDEAWKDKDNRAFIIKNAQAQIDAGDLAHVDYRVAAHWRALVAQA